MSSQHRRIVSCHDTGPVIDIHSERVNCEYKLFRTEQKLDRQVGMQAASHDLQPM